MKRDQDKVSKMSNIDPGNSGDLLPLFLAWLGIKPANFIAGFAGGTVTALTRRKGAIIPRFAAAFSGALMATWLTPFVAPVVLFIIGDYALKSGANLASVEGAVGFMLGYVGKELVEMGIEWIRSWISKTSPKLPESKKQDAE